MIQPLPIPELKRVMVSWRGCSAVSILVFPWTVVYFWVCEMTVHVVLSSSSPSSIRCMLDTASSHMVDLSRVLFLYEMYEAFFLLHLGLVIYICKLKGGVIFFHGNLNQVFASEQNVVPKFFTLRSRRAKHGILSSLSRLVVSGIS